MRRWRTNVLLFSNDITILYRSLFPSSVCITFLLTCIMLHDFNKGAKIMEILSGRAFIYFALIKFSIYFPIKEKFFRILISRGTGFGSHTLHVCYYLKHVNRELFILIWDTSKGQVPTITIMVILQLKYPVFGWVLLRANFLLVTGYWLLITSY